MGKVRKIKNGPTPTGGNYTTWDAASTQLLLNSWEENVREWRGSTATTNVQMYRKIASKLSKYHGEIKTKVDNMKRKYRIELTKIDKTGEPSSWVYFKQMEIILKDSISFNLPQDDNFDFSPWDDDSDSSRHSDFWTNNYNEQPKIQTTKKDDSVTSDSDLDLDNEHSNIYITETETNHTPDIDDSVKLDLDFSTNSDAPELYIDVEAKSVDILAIEEAKLAIQKEKLKILKSVADELSSIHREFLKVYKHK
ncbi:uncharacterized protein LOC117782226 [Drosophila innubila]|uniref:uncharacterized protein LOC117782226 n=1 Tax=Drosophila innubila TaxID=198719 RepID=UPI00148C7D93|nr:uncharacterized protein LOC117782226 [Drosophila innubila]